MGRDFSSEIQAQENSQIVQTSSSIPSAEEFENASSWPRLIPRVRTCIVCISLLPLQPGIARPILPSMWRPFHVCFPRRRWEDLLSLLEALPPLLLLEKGAVLLAELIDIGCWVDHLLSRAGHWDIEYQGIILDFLIFKKILTQISHADSPAQQT